MSLDLYEIQQNSEIHCGNNNYKITTLVPSATWK